MSPFVRTHTTAYSVSIFLAVRHCVRSFEREFRIRVEPTRDNRGTNAAVKPTWKYLWRPLLRFTPTWQRKKFKKGHTLRSVLYLFLCLSVLLPQGCTRTLLHSSPTPLHGLDTSKIEFDGCENFFSQLDQQVDYAGVRDAEQAQIQGFPYLRVDRLLSSYRAEVINETKLNAWVDRLQFLDREARAKEVANLLPAYGSHHETISQDKDDIMDTVVKCGTLLRTRDLSKESNRDALRQAAIVPAEYQTYKRVLGFYPISAQVVLRGIKRLHEETSRILATPKGKLPVQGELVTFLPPLAAEILNRQQVADIIRKSADNPLGIPEPEANDRKRLFNTFVPIWEIDVASNNDLIGSLRWADDDKPYINTEQPRVYQRISHVRFQGRVLLQLNYQVWFAARPVSGAFDLLGGHLDGIIWRVTLGPTGEPILFDAIHSCGCYHMYFPSTRLRYKGKAFVYDEPLLIPRNAPRQMDNQRMVIRIAHTTHYLQNLSLTKDTPKGRTIEFEDYHRLRSLPLPSGGYRSLFGADGIVAGTERGERWVFWPMGVPEPGAMRQWGHHATAFVGRRHFDDPDLLDRYFEFDKWSFCQTGSELFNNC